MSKDNYEIKEFTKNEVQQIQFRTHFIQELEAKLLIHKREIKLFFDELKVKYGCDGDGWMAQNEAFVRNKKDLKVVNE